MKHLCISWTKQSNYRPMLMMLLTNCFILRNELQALKNTLFTFFGWCESPCWLSKIRNLGNMGVMSWFGWGLRSLSALVYWWIYCWRYITMHFIYQHSRCIQANRYLHVLSNFTVTPFMCEEVGGVRRIRNIIMHFTNMIHVIPGACTTLQSKFLLLLACYSSTGVLIQP